MTETRTPAEAARDRLKALRKSLPGVTQDDLASAARRWGLDWTRNTVANIEAGRHEFTLIEAAVLTVVLRTDFSVDVQVVDLLPDDVWVNVGAGRIHGAGLRAALADGADDAPPWQFETRHAAARNAVERGAVQGIAAAARHTAQAAQRVWPDAAVADVVAAEEDARGAAEQKAARSLGAEPLDVALAARRLWRRSLTEERDARASEASGADATPRQRQAIRGHVTRALLEDLRPVLMPDE